MIRAACTLLAAALLAACAGAPPDPDELRSLGPVAVVTRLETAPECRLARDGGLPVSGAAAVDEDDRLSRVVAAVEGAFELETRFRGELVDRLGDPAPFAIAPPGRVRSLTGSLLVRDEAPGDYTGLAAAGLEAVLEVAIRRIELRAAEGGRPAGLHVFAAARLLSTRDGAELWRREVEVVPDATRGTAFAAPLGEAGLEAAYLAALGAAARQVGTELAGALTAR